LSLRIFQERLIAINEVFKKLDVIFDYDERMIKDESTNEYNSFEFTNIYKSLHKQRQIILSKINDL
jgi:hypothetical protein